MTRPVPYLFCRYSLSIGGKDLSGAEQHSALVSIKGRPVAHWKRNPTPADRDTFAMRPKMRRIGREPVLVWCVSYDIQSRDVAKYIPTDDDISMSHEAAEGIRYTTFIAVPRLRVLAVDDRASDVHMGGIRGVRRFISVFRQIKGGAADIRLAAGWNDVSSALNDWSLTEFSFSVRPFNPSPKTPGDKVHDMMVADGMGTMRGVARPSEGKTMQMGEGGYIAETLGLAQRGYGQIGVKGYTPDGHEAAYGKPKFSVDKQENEKQKNKPQSLKVYIDPQETEDETIGEVAKALLGFYDRRDQTA